MAGKFLLGTTLWTFTASASSSAPDHPASNAAMIERPFETWEANTGDASPYVVLDMGTARLPRALVLNNLGFGDVSLEAGADGVSFPDFITLQSVPFNARVRRSMIFLDLLGLMTTARRYLRVGCFTFTSAPFIGSAVIVGSMADMVRNWGRSIDWTPKMAATRLGMVGGGAPQINREGRFFLEYQLQGGPWLRDAMAQLLELHAVQAGVPFVMYENRDDKSQAYLLQRETDVTFSERKVTFEAPWTFSEFI